MPERIIVDEANRGRLVTAGVIGVPWALILGVFVRTTGPSLLPVHEHLGGWGMIAIFWSAVLLVLVCNLRQRRTRIDAHGVVVTDAWLGMTLRSTPVVPGQLGDVVVESFKGGFAGRRWQVLTLRMADGASMALNTSADATRVQEQRDAIRAALAVRSGPSSRAERPVDNGHEA